MSVTNNIVWLKFYPNIKKQYSYARYICGGKFIRKKDAYQLAKKGVICKVHPKTIAPYPKQIEVELLRYEFESY